MRSEGAEFGVTIDYVRGQSNPVQVFQAMTDLLAGFTNIDRVLIDAVAPEIEAVAVIEEIEAASITAWVTNKLKKIDDEALKDLDVKKQIGAYVVKAKYRIIDFLEELEQKQTLHRQEQLRRDLEAIGASLDLQLVPPTIDLKALAPGMNQIQRGKERLTRDEKLTLRSEYAPDREVRVEDSEPVTISEPERDVDASETGGTAEMMLLIKKPDLLGKSQWEFRHGKHTLRANVEDADWLEKFHSGSERIVPGSVMKASVRYAYKYDDRGNLLETVHDVVAVRGLISPTPQEQEQLFGPDDDAQ